MPPAARKGDPGFIHCSPYDIASGSPNVFINNRPAARIGDKSSLHLKPAAKICIPHTASITQGAATVRINGRPAARKGSSLAGCTRVNGGSPNVEIGGPSIGGGGGLVSTLFSAISYAQTGMNIASKI